MAKEEVGSVSILGSIDVENLMQGLREMKRGLDEAKASARTSFGDLEKIGEAVAGIAAPLALIGVGVASAILGLAAMAPAVAPALAKMEVGFLKLIRILGEELQPVFEEAAVLFQGFVEWLDSNEGRGAIKLFGDALQVVLDILKEIGSWVTSEEAKNLIKFVEAVFEPRAIQPAPEYGAPYAPTAPTGPFTIEPPGVSARPISPEQDFKVSVLGGASSVLSAPANLFDMAMSAFWDFTTNENPRLSVLRYAGISSP